MLRRLERVNRTGCRLMPSRSSTCGTRGPHFVVGGRCSCPPRPPFRGLSHAGMPAHGDRSRPRQLLEFFSIPRKTSALITLCESIRIGASASTASQAAIPSGGEYRRIGNARPGVARAPLRPGSGQIRIVIRGFDIDHRVKRLVGEGQALGVALHEIQAGQIVPFWQKAIPAGFKSSPV